MVASIYSLGGRTEMLAEEIISKLTIRIWRIITIESVVNVIVGAFARMNYLP
jgi:hypothetical protein